MTKIKCKITNIECRECAPVCSSKEIWKCALDIEESVSEAENKKNKIKIIRRNKNEFTKTI